MMLALGMFVFMRQTLPHQTMQRESDYRWPSNSRIGKRDAYQFLGVGEENITLAGVVYPELTGGKPPSDHSIDSASSSRPRSTGALPFIPAPR